jgi:sigma-B regulation protein RsbU (phosphoserine phosphatase)
MPPHPPKLDRAEFAARFMAARSIGGDVYDFLDYGPARIAIALGDVSGKAAPAALYAALVSGILRSLAAQHLSPAALLTALNDQLQERRLDSQYVTMLVAIWDDTNQTLQIANAGSVQPLFVSMISSGSRTTVDVKTIQAEGFPLGLFSDVEYEEFTLSTRSGDLIVFFSDGIPDAENAAGEMFGTERLAKVLKSMRVPTASSTVQSIVDSVSRFQSGTEHFDDETLVVLRVL